MLMPASEPQWTSRQIARSSTPFKLSSAIEHCCASPVSTAAPVNTDVSNKVIPRSLENNTVIRPYSGVGIWDDCCESFERMHIVLQTVLTRQQEFDTPANLYKFDNGIFRSMCQRSNITGEDIDRSRARTGKF